MLTDIKGNRYALHLLFLQLVDVVVGVVRGHGQEMRVHPLDVHGDAGVVRVREQALLVHQLGKPRNMRDLLV